MKSNLLSRVLLCSALLAASLISARAQTVANWIGPATGGEWNTDTNWDTGAPPLDATTNAYIGISTNVDYNVPMAATSFGDLSLDGILNVNAGGFNCGSMDMRRPSGSGRFYINNGGVVNVADNLRISTNAQITVAAGGTLTVGGTFTLDYSTSSKFTGSGGIFTNNGGTLTASATTINNGGGTGTGLLVINDGINYLGITGIGRNKNGASFGSLGSEGLIIYGGLVVTTNLNAGNGYGNSSLTALVAGGIVTNNGSVFINQGSSGRASRVLQTGGLFVTPDPGVVNPDSTVSGSIAIYSVTGGTNIVGGFYFGDTNGSASTVNFTNQATVYVGSKGINWNGAVSLNASLNDGGLFGATAPWLGSAPMKLASGTFTFQTADMDNHPNNITLSEALSGNGNLNLTGGGKLLLQAANTYSGSTLVNASTLALDTAASITTPVIIVGPNATFDVSALAGSYTLNGGQTLAGSGVVTGVVNVAAAAIVNPGSNILTGTLTFTNDLIEINAANNHFDLPNDPTSANNDSLVVGGTLTVSGTNTVEINGGTGSGAYKLIQYGALNGDITNFALTGVTGALSNSASAKAIYLVVSIPIRGPTNVVWVGNPESTNWDVELSTNWLNAGVLDFFVPGDFAHFDNTGAANPLVNIPGSVTPGSVTVDSTANYTLAGVGSIAGLGAVTKTNSGTLTILTTNTYTGVTTINGGVLEVAQVAAGGFASGIGAAGADSGNLVISNGTFRYSGPSASTDRGATLDSADSAVDVTVNGNLTLSGVLTGSGGLTKVGNGTLILSGGNSYAGSTVLSNGTVQINTAASALPSTPVAFDGGTLSLNVSGQPTYLNPFDVTTTGTLISAGGNNNIVQGSWSGVGTLNMSVASGYLTINGDITNFAGTIVVSDTSAGIFRFNAGGSDPCIGSSFATFDLGNSSVAMVNRNGSSYGATNYFLGGLAGGSTTTLRGAQNTGTPNNYVVGDNNQNTIFKGTIANGAGGGGAAVSIVKSGSGTLTLEGQNTFTGTTTVSNGVLALATNPDTSSDGSLDSSSVIDVASGGILDVSGRSDGTLNANNLLRGRGIIRGTVSVSGTISPGGGPTGATGTLTVTNNVNLSATAWMKLDRSASPNSDRVVSTLGAITYGGTLIVTNIGGRLQAGDTFTLFSGGGLSVGTFGSMQLPSYYSWDTSQLGVNGSITVTAVMPPPAITNVDFSTLASGTVTVNAAHGIANAPVNVLTATNLLGAWTTFTTTTFDANGDLSVPVTVDPAAPEFFIKLQAN